MIEYVNDPFATSRFETTERAEAELTPLQMLGNMPSEEITPGTIQNVINWLDPHSPSAVSDAEELVGHALGLTRIHPGDEDFEEVFQRAYNVLVNRVEIARSRESS